MFSVYKCLPPVHSIRMSAYTNVLLYECPLIRMSAYTNVRLYECPLYECPLIRMSAYTNVRLYECPLIRMSAPPKKQYYQPLGCLRVPGFVQTQRASLLPGGARAAPTQGLELVFRLQGLVRGVLRRGTERGHPH